MPLRPEFAALEMVTESGADGKGSGGSGDDGKRAKTELGRLRSDSSYRIDEIGAIALVNDPHDASRAALVRAASMLHQWDFDAFDVAGACALPLAFVGLEVLGSRDLLGELKIDWATLGRFLSRVDEAYCSDVPYHNSTHATDVTGTMNYFLTTGGLERHLTPVQTFSVLLGVMIHDVGHIGLNTAFLKGTNHELAIRYNDHSPLENMHLATAFGLMLDSSKRCDVFEHLEPALRSEIRFNMIDLVLATDMADHNRVRIFFSEFHSREVSSSLVNVEAVHLVSRHHFPCARMNARTQLSSLYLTHTRHTYTYTRSRTHSRKSHTHTSSSPTRTHHSFLRNLTACSRGTARGWGTPPPPPPPQQQQQQGEHLRSPA
jgi:hypothetical protein